MVRRGNLIAKTTFNALKKHGVKCTFFVGGCWADDNERTLKRIVYDCHEIANHGYFHKDHKNLSYDDNKKEIEKSDFSVHEIMTLASMAELEAGNNKDDEGITDRAKVVGVFINRINKKMKLGEILKEIISRFINIENVKVSKNKFADLDEVIDDEIIEKE